MTTIRYIWFLYPSDHMSITPYAYIGVRWRTVAGTFKFLTMLLIIYEIGFWLPFVMFQDFLVTLQALRLCPLTMVSNCGPHHLMRPQYCGCGRHHNGNTLQLRCEMKSYGIAATKLQQEVLFIFI